jgi:hypothetical protein
VLEHPKETSNRYLHVYSVETSQNEILTALEKSTAAKWTVSSTTTDEQVTEGRNKLGAGDFSGAFNLVRATVYGNTAGLRSDYTKVEGLANNILGLKTESVQETTDRVMKK